MSTRAHKKDPDYAEFSAYMDSSLSELPADDHGRNDARRTLFSDFGLPEDLVFLLWKGIRAAAPTQGADGESLRPANQCDGCRAGHIIGQSGLHEYEGHGYMTCQAKRYVGADGESLRPVAWQYKVAGRIELHSHQLDHFYFINGAYVKGTPLYDIRDAAPK